MSYHDEAHDDFGGLNRDLRRLLAVGRPCRSWVERDWQQFWLPVATRTHRVPLLRKVQLAVPIKPLPLNRHAPKFRMRRVGPFPADGTNGPNILEIGGVVRRDMTESVGEFSGRADGVAMTFDLTIVEATTGAPIPGAAMYLWHCTADGQYSIYQIEDQNYLRAVQVADADGNVSFTSIFPGCYRGRWPHCHFEVFQTVEAATSGDQAIKTSQLALPEAECAVVYADRRYGSSLDSLDELSLNTDGVFADGWSEQLASVSGDVDAGYSASLLVPI